MRSIHEDAYARWEARGRPIGDDWADWFAAEAGAHRRLPAADDDELLRYVEHLQRVALSPGWELFFDAGSAARRGQAEHPRLREIAASFQPGDPDILVRQHQELIGRFTPSTSFELPETHAIFGPILDEVRAASRRMGLLPVREVRLVTSTDISASPAALPTSDEHLLFIGPGTSSFCNYWAKAFTAVVKAIASQSMLEVLSAADLDAAFRSDPSALALAVRIALYEATFGTMIGFGEVIQPDSFLGYRMQLLRAIEQFVVAHEFAHFFAEERLPHFSGVLDTDMGCALESLCDELGLGLSRECSGENYLMFSGAGAVVFLRATELVAAVRELMTTETRGGDGRAVRAASVRGSHPAEAERIASIVSRIGANTAPDQKAQAIRFVAEYDRIAVFLNQAIVRTVRDALSEDRRDRDRT